MKSLLSGKGAKFTVLELDNMGGAPQSRPAKGPGGADFATTTAAEGGDIQSALATMTGQRTVPSVWIGNQHVGGCDATKALDAQGKLVPMLKAAGVV